MAVSSYLFDFCQEFAYSIYRGGEQQYLKGYSEMLKRVHFGHICRENLLGSMGTPREVARPRLVG
jgi:hypothetical protein